jgi:hypothetical protein
VQSRNARIEGASSSVKMLSDIKKNGSPRATVGLFLHSALTEAGRRRRS